MRIRVILDDGDGAHFADAEVLRSVLDGPADKVAAMYLVPQFLAALALLREVEA